MSEPSNDIGKKSETVVDQVLEGFYKALAEKEGYTEIATRFRGESGRSESIIRKILFQDEE